MLIKKRLISILNSNSDVDEFVNIYDDPDNYVLFFIDNELDFIAKILDLSSHLEDCDQATVKFNVLFTIDEKNEIRLEDKLKELFKDFTLLDEE